MCDRSESGNRVHRENRRKRLQSEERVVDTHVAKDEGLDSVRATCRESMM